MSKTFLKMKRASFTVNPDIMCRLTTTLRI